MASPHSRHRRFFLAFAFGIGIFGLGHLGIGLDWLVSALAGFDGFALSYLALMVHYANRTPGAELRRHAAEGDEGTALILLLALSAVGASIAAVLFVMAGPAGTFGHLGSALALAAVPLGWAVVQTLTAFRYAHLHYSNVRTRHLTFPGTDAPDPWDFLYFALSLIHISEPTRPY